VLPNKLSTLSSYFIRTIKSMAVRYDRLGMWKTWGRRESHNIVLVGRAQRSMRLVRIMPTCYDNIKIRFKATRWEDVESINLGWGYEKQLAVVNTVMNLRVLRNSDNFLTRRKPVRYAGKFLLHQISHLLEHGHSGEPNRRPVDWGITRD
jgi:hypothetical protein